MDEPAGQHLRVLDEDFLIEQLDGAGAEPRPGWTVLVRGPRGLTVVRPADGGSGDRWKAFYSGDTAHDLDVPGMLSALLRPLAATGVPVFVASTYEADLVLVPEDRLDAATGALTAAGHQVRVPDGAGENR